MKTTHKVELAGQKVAMNLSFQTSLTILDELASPSHIVQEATLEAIAMRDGRTYDPRFKLTERGIIQIFSIASGKSFEECGKLCFEEGFVRARMIAVDYLTELVIGRSKEIEPDDASEGETSEGE